jgi:hypothetical protein
MHFSLVCKCQNDCCRNEFFLTHELADCITFGGGIFMLFELKIIELIKRELNMLQA